MKFHAHCGLLIVVTALLFAGSGRAAVVMLKNSAEPVIGYVVDQNENRIIIRQRLPTGEGRDRIILSGDIDEVIVTVPTDRLAQLDHKDPSAYRDFAEELHEKQRDPEAREAAIRLYLIAAYLDPNKMGRSALLGLIDLSRTENERRKFRAMAYLLDPEHDASVLKSAESLTAPAPQRLDAESRGRIVAVLRLLRQGRWDEALDSARKFGLQQQLAAFGELLPYHQFEAACTDRRISPALLKSILAVELSLSPRATEEIEIGVEADNPVSWQASIARDGKTPLPALSLETITEFNPRQCQFRDGKWTVPDDL